MRYAVIMATQTNSKKRHFCILVIASLIFSAGQEPALAEVPAEISFDLHVAPLLAVRCLSCHNANERKGGLNLFTENSAKIGGDGGAAVTPGKLDESLLWEQVDAGAMPPNQPLSDDEKEILRRWIADGAPWGTDPIDPYRFSTDDRAGYDWWSLEPVAKPQLPEVKDTDWVQNDVDRFILSKLEAANLSPSKQATPRTLLRRLYIDLIGLPPIVNSVDGVWQEQLLGIEIDPRSLESFGSSYNAVVDALLASPHYGERWGRHWLDVIRFGQSQGFERNRVRPNLWRYRDWVIDSLNRDLPYDEFLRLQIAGDVLNRDDLDSLIATGYLVCGPYDMVGYEMGSPAMKKAVRQDELEDLVATVGQSMLGLTVNCARCHDHKFDPISQREYYQFAALLGGVTQAVDERKGIQLQQKDANYDQWVQQRNQLRDDLLHLQKMLRDNYATNDSSEHPIDGLLALYLPDRSDGKNLPDQRGTEDALNLVAGDKVPFASATPASKLVAAIKSTNEFAVEAWLTPGKNNQSGPARIVTLSSDSSQRNFTLGQDGDRFDLRFRNTSTDQNGLPSTTSGSAKVSTQKTHIVFTLGADRMLRCFVDAAQVSERPISGDLSNWNENFRLALGDELTGDRRWDGKLHFVAVYNKGLSTQQIRQNFESQSNFPRSVESIETLLAKATAQEKIRYAEAKQDLQQLESSEPTKAFDGVAHVIIPKQPPKFHVLIRGNSSDPGDEVSPQGLQALTKVGLSADFGLTSDAPEAQRRVALAEWITDPRNPLTSRVIVNRLWHYHFGQGIVDSPSDFGFAGGRPSHPELLDWLAGRLVDGGWRLKQLHRLIVTSATYRQASNVSNSAAEQTDADNRLLWRGNLRRMDGESTRDSMLAVSGALNRRLHGPSYFDLEAKLENDHSFGNPTGEFNDDVNRRTIYRLWARCGNNPLLELLDCPDPSVMLPRRAQTITPTQSLSLMNNRFVEHCAQRLADKVRDKAGADLDRQIEVLYQLTLLRSPKPAEQTLASSFLQKQTLTQLCIVLLNTNEFLFVE